MWARASAGAGRQAPTHMSTIRTIFRVARRHPYRCGVAAVAFIAIVTAMWVRLGPIPAELLDVSDAASTVVVDRHGVPLYEALSGDGTRSIRLEADRLPPMLAAATVAAEDRRFYSHTGIDPMAIVRAREAEHRRAPGRRRRIDDHAADREAAARSKVDRRARERSRASFRRPCSRSVWSIGSPRTQILALYLNLAAYGNQVVGAGRASYAYFGHDASMLTPAQAAFLAGLPQRPTGFNPYRNPKSALARQRAVLRRMQASGAITGRTGARGGRRAAGLHEAADAVRGAGTSSRGCLQPSGRNAPDASRRRSTPGCRRTSPESSAASGPSSIGMAPRTSPSSSSTTHAASGSRGKDRATTSIRRMAARSTASCRRGSRDRR